ncbi:MAG: hypothetical protein K2P12_02495, partial [Clostridia bacterium]|nr:hypothetical protein [Clostridia bacterium]
MDEKEELLEKYNGVECGRLTGGKNLHNLYGDIANSGGAIILNDSGVLNIYGGMFDNNQSNYGGFIATGENTTVNIYGGLFMNNQSTGDAGVGFIMGKCYLHDAVFLNNTAGNGGVFYFANNNVYAEITSIGYIYNCLAMYNTATIGGVLYGYRGSKYTVYGGKFVKNLARGRMGAIGGTSYCEITIYGGEIHDNEAVDFGGGVGIYNKAKLTIINAEIYDNNSKRGGGVYASDDQSVIYIQGGNIYNNAATEAGGGICIDQQASLKLTGGKIYNNTAVYGGGVEGDSNSELSLSNSVITGNSATSQGGGVRNYSGVINVGAGLQVYSNKLNDKDDDLFLLKGQKIIIKGILTTGKKSTYIGISLASNFGDNEFTANYGFSHATIEPSKFFFSSNTNYPVILRGEDAAFATSGERPSELITWKITEKDNEGHIINEITTNDFHLDVTYSSNIFVLSNDKCTFSLQGGTSATTGVSQYSMNKAGSYSFYTDNIYKNPIFTLNILPKEIDVIWTNTDLIFNGEEQSPECELVGVAESDNCTITLIGGMCEVGNYSAMVSALSNGNYVLRKNANKSTAFTISKADLEITIQTQDMEKEYTGKNVEVKDSWYKITGSGVGQDSNKKIESLFNIDKKAIVAQFNNSDSVVNIGEYGITTKSIDASKVFSGNNNYNVIINYENTGVLRIVEPSVVLSSVESGYSYIYLENDKRVTYKEKGMVHGVDDKEQGDRLILGNIAPYTSVNEFINNIVYKDKERLTIYNSNDYKIYENGSAASGVDSSVL